MTALDACERHTLAARETLVLENTRDTALHCLTGSVWVTRYGSTLDAVVLPGQQFRIPRHSVAVVSSHKGATFALRPVAHTRPANAWQQIADLLGLLNPARSPRVASALRHRLLLRRPAGGIFG